jgi:AsmA protein
VNEKETPVKRIAGVVGIVIVFLLAAAAALPFLIDGNQFRPALESRLSAALGRQVKIGKLKISLFSGGAAATDVSIADDRAFSQSPFLQAESLKIGVELLPLILHRALKVTGVTIEDPQIHIIETAAGAFNLSSIGAKSGADQLPPAAAEPPGTPTQPPSLSIARIEISGGKITFEKRAPGARPSEIDKLNLVATNFSPGAAFPVSVSAEVPGGGTVHIVGTAGPFDSGHAMDTPFSAKFHIDHLDLVASGLVHPDDGISGLASLDGSAESVRGTIGATAKFTADHVILAKGGSPARKPIAVDFSLSHHLATQSGDIHKMVIHLGSVDANLDGIYHLETEPASVNLHLTGSGIQLPELASFLPALNFTLPSGSSITQGAADLNVTSSGPLNALVTQGHVAAHDVRLSDYDFASKLQVLHEFTGVKAQPHTLIQTLSSDLNHSVNGTVLDNVQLAVAGIGAIVGRGAISPSHALNFKLRLALGGGALASLGGGQGGIPFTIQGTADHPVIRPDIGGMVTNTLKDLTGGKSAGSVASGLLNDLLGGGKK